MIRYNYIAESYLNGKDTTMIKGCFDDSQTDRDFLTDKALFLVASTAQETGLPWNPFNVQLIVKAQPAPKPKKHYNPHYPPYAQ